MNIAETVFNVDVIRKSFPSLHQRVNESPLVYFDNAATSQKPQMVIDAISEYYQTINSNVHRGVHHLSQLATEAYETSRKKVQLHLHAKHSHEIIFTKGTTDGINLVAFGLGQELIKAKDEIIISVIEHHSNIVPWKMLCERNRATLKVIPANEKGELIQEEYDKLLSNKTKLVAFNHVSNTLGTINPVKEMTTKAHAVGAVVLVDGAQAVPHMALDVQDLNADFYVFSSHKMFGPTGIGVLYGKEEWLEKLPPYQGGGEMIRSVSFEKIIYAELPYKFEAGTPNIEAGIVLGKVVDFLQEIGLENIVAYEQGLLDYGTQRLMEVDRLRVIGQAEKKASVISFLLGDLHPYDVGSIIDKLGIAVRTGHHCTQPLMDYFNIPGTIRASFSFYNTKEEIDRMIKALRKAQMMLS